MKKALLTFAVLLLVTVAFSQTSFKLINASGQIHNGDTVRYDTTLVSISELIADDLRLVSTTGSNIAINMVKYNSYIVSGADNSFCFCANCFPPFVMTAGPCALNSGDTMVDFSAHYYPYSNCGTSYVAYTFSVNGTPNDSVQVMIEFVVVCAGVDEHGTVCQSSALFPNPASREAVFSYSLNQYSPDLKLTVFNITGEKVFEKSLMRQSDNVTLPVAEFAKGMYYCTLTGEGTTLTSRKLIVN